MNVYELKSFRGGISDYEDKGIDGAFKFASNADIRKRVDSFSCNQALVDEGLHSSHSPSASQSPSGSVSSSASPSFSASPSATPSPSSSVSRSASTTPSASASPSSSNSPSPSPSAGIGTVFKDLIKWFVKASDGYTYGFGNTGYVYRRDSSGFWLQVYKDSNGEIKGAYEKPSNQHKTYLYWATNKVLKRKEIPGNASWNDVTTIDSNLESTDYHTMVQTGGGLKIANRDKLALVGYDNSYTSEALDLIPGNLAKTLIERDGRVIIGTYPAGDQNKGTNAAIDCEHPLAQIGDDGDVYFANMVDTTPYKRFPGGGKVNPGGVCNEIDQSGFFEWEENALSWIDKQTVHNLSYWGVYGADSGKNGVYSIGRKNKNHPFVMNLEYKMDVDEIGAVAVVNGTVLASYRDGSDFGVMAEDPNTKAEATLEGLDFRSPIKKVDELTPWKYAEVFMKPLPSGCYVQFWYRIDKYGDFIQAKTPDGQTNFTTAGEKKAIFQIGADGQIFEEKVVAHPYGNDCPDIYRTRVYFD